MQPSRDPETPHNNPARRQIVHETAFSATETAHVVQRRAARAEARTRLHELRPGPHHRRRRLPLLLITQEARQGGHLPHRVRNRAAHRAHVRLHRVPLSLKRRADVNHPLHLVRTRLHTQPRLHGLLLAAHRTQREPTHRPATFTSEPASSAFASPMNTGFRHTEKNELSGASAHKFTMSARVAVGFRRGWGWTKTASRSPEYPPPA